MSDSQFFYSFLFPREIYDDVTNYCRPLNAKLACGLNVLLLYSVQETTPLVELWSFNFLEHPYCTNTLSCFTPDLCIEYPSTPFAIHADQSLDDVFGHSVVPLHAELFMRISDQPARILLLLLLFLFDEARKQYTSDNPRAVIVISYIVALTDLGLGEFKFTQA